MSYGLLLLRVVIGLTVAVHGTQKLFGWFGGPSLKGTAGWFGQTWRAPALMALGAGLAETCGIGFAAGFLTPLFALGIVVIMLNAIYTVHWPNGFFAMDGGYEFNLALLTVAIAVAATGPGRFSLDRALGWDDNLSGLWWGVGVLGAAFGVSALTLALFYRPQQAGAADVPDEPATT
jgi:putative oxidoreductase